MPLKKILLLALLSLMCSASYGEDNLKSLGKFKDWEAIVSTEDTGKVCFAQSSPILQAPKSNKRDAKLFIAFRPNDKIIDEVSVTAGYEFNKNNSVTATSGKNKFKFDIKEQGFAWIADTKIEFRMIKRMKKASRLMIIGNTNKGDETTDHYSMMGFTKAYNSAKKSCS